MILLISNEYDKSFEENTFKLGTYMLKIKATHLFIASHMWDKIHLELNDDIPEGYLKSLTMVCKDIRVKLPDDITSKTLQHLTDIYPDKAGLLRRYFMQGKDLREVLTECMV